MSGTRPDVAAAYAAYPNATRASVFDIVPIFGWTLTPGPAIVPLDGSPGTCNDDIAQAFGANYRNLSEGRGAIGSYVLDTTTLSDGLHELVWRVTDSFGAVQGLGSRYIHVNNQPRGR